MKLRLCAGRPAVAVATLAFCLAGHATAANAPFPGAIFTTTANGAVVNANTQYDSKCAVYLDGGPGPNAPSRAAGLPEGEYYFQVTDPSGKTLLSTDPVSNRRFRVSSDGVIVAYTGVGGPAHPIGVDQDHAAKGAVTIRLANLDCPTDFLNTPSQGGVYKVWVTPVGDGTPTGGGFVGDPSLVDNGYGSGYYHGFLPARSKTDNFKVREVESSVTFCLTLQKQIELPNGTLTASPNWEMNLKNPQGATNPHFTETVSDTLAEVKICSLTPGEYTVTESLVFEGLEYFVRGLIINGEEQGNIQPVYSFAWQSGNPEPVVLFQNKVCEDQPCLR